MHVHILGICGTFMGGVARLAQQLGHTVTGSDRDVYPPMSTQLTALGIDLTQGYDPEQLDPAPDVVIVGNALSRGNPAVETVLDRGLRYTSGAQWLAEHVLADRWVVAVAGTHGKTTVASLVAWVLEHAGLNPGFLIGGIPRNFGVSARLGKTPFFVVEADEYDTAFFDKRSKFVHYRPRTAVLNNLEFDHADIFDDLAAIKRQFHHFVRTVPGKGLLITNASDRNLDHVLKMGCWSSQEFFNHETKDLDSEALHATWTGRKANEDYSAFAVAFENQVVGSVRWPLIGRHNMTNALAAVAAARHVGVAPHLACAAASSFRSVQRRLQLLANGGGIRIYDDFAHHPTEIRETLLALRSQVGKQRIVAVLEPRSNTMRMGKHQAALPDALSQADWSLLYRPANLGWDANALSSSHVEVLDSVASIIERLAQGLRKNDQVVIMTNGGFDNLQQRLLTRLGLKTVADRPMKYR